MADNNDYDVAAGAIAAHAVPQGKESSGPLGKQVKKAFTIASLVGQAAMPSPATLATVGVVGAAATTTACHDVLEEVIVTKAPQVGEPEITKDAIITGKFGVYYGALSSLTPEQRTAAQKYGKLLLEPGAISASQAKAAGFNAAGYSSGIGVNDQNHDLDVIRAQIDAIDGWLKKPNGDRIESTGGGGTFLVNLRDPRVAYIMLQHAVDIGKAYQLGGVIDEADQAIFWENVYKQSLAGTTVAFAQFCNDVAVLTYYGAPLESLYKKDPVTNAVVRNDILDIVKGPDGNFVAQNSETKEYYTPTFHPTEFLSGLQPSANGLRGDLARMFAISGCGRIDESRVYQRGGVPNTRATQDSVITAQVEQAVAAYKAGHTGIRMTLLEPSTDEQPGTLEGSRIARDTTVIFARRLTQEIKKATGQEFKVELDIFIAATENGLFTFDSPNSKSTPAADGLVINIQLEENLAHRGTSTGAASVSSESMAPKVEQPAVQAEPMPRAPAPQKIDFEKLIKTKALKFGVRIGTRFDEHNTDMPQLVLKENGTLDVNMAYAAELKKITDRVNSLNTPEIAAVDGGPTPSDWTAKYKSDTGPKFDAQANYARIEEEKQKMIDRKKALDKLNEGALIAEEAKKAEAERAPSADQDGDGATISASTAVNPEQWAAHRRRMTSVTEKIIQGNEQATTPPGTHAEKYMSGLGVDSSIGRG